MKYKAVIFDLFGTLIHAWSPVRDRETMAHMASVLSMDTSVLRQKWQETTDARMTGFFQSYESCLQDICCRLKVNVNEKQIELAATIRLSQTSEEMKPFEDAVPILSGIKSKGLLTGLISNLSMASVAYWQNSPLALLVDAAVLSCCEGLKKPDRQIFLLACQRLSVAPEDCLYIADGMDNELDAAAAIGMYPVLVHHYGTILSRDGANWQGPVITSLNEVYRFL